MSSPQHAVSAELSADPNRAFWMFWSASTVSAWGTGITSVAMPALALTVLDATAFQASLIAASADAAWLLIGLPAGALVQRYPLRRVQVAMDSIRAAALISVPALYVLGLLSVIHLVAVCLVIGFCDVIFSVGNSTFLARLVPKHELIKRNSINSGTQSASQFGAPALAGVVVAVLGPVIALVVDALTYLTSATILGRLPNAGKPNNKLAGDPLRTQIAEGIRYVARHRIMRPCVIAATIVNFSGGVLMAATPLVVVLQYGLSAGLIGLVLAAEGLGAVAGAAVTTRLADRVGSGRAAIVALWIAATGAVVMPLGGGGTTGTATLATGSAICSLGVVIFSVVTRSHRQAESPPELLSRVMATVRFVSWGALPLGSLTAGAVATRFDPRTALLVVPATMVVAAVYIAMSPVREHRSLERGAEQDAAT